MLFVDDKIVHLRNHWSRRDAYQHGRMCLYVTQLRILRCHNVV